MYCSNCGNEIKNHLNYCNNCGSRIEKNPLVISNSSSNYLVKVVGMIGISGFLGFIAILKILLESRLDQPAILTILFAYLVTLFLICSVLVGHIWKNAGDIRIKSNPEKSEDLSSPKQFSQINTNQLESAIDPFISVTETTTKTLDKVVSKGGQAQRN